MLKIRPGFVLSLAFLLASLSQLPGQTLTHGQMLGEPGPDSAVVWARLSGPAYVVVRYDTVPTLSNAQESTVHQADAARDFTVRVQLDGLLPGTRYWYALHWSTQPPPAMGTLGPIGSFTTAPPSGAAVPVTFAFGAEVRDLPEYGIFNAIAAQDPAFYLSLGDFPYCVGAVTLSDYWGHHKAARASPVLHAFLLDVPVVAVWDDNEIANDWDATTAAGAVQNGIQAFRDYMPLADSAGEVYRRLSFGTALDLFVLDTRSHRGVNAAPNVPGKSMLGSAQMQWLQQGLLASTARFKLIATSVPLRYATQGGDAWDGYMHERQALLDFVTSNRILDVVFLAGDRHYAALHHHREGVVEVLAGPLAAGVSTGNGYLEPEQRWEAHVHNFAMVQVDPTASPPTLTIGWHDQNGILLRQETLAASASAATLMVDTDMPEGGFQLTGGPLHVRDAGRQARRSRLAPGSYRVLFRDLPFGPGSPATADLQVPPGADVWLAADHDDLPAAHPVLLARDFDAPLDSLSDFTIVDQGTISAPSSWLTNNGTLNQTTNIRTRIEPEAPGTMAVAGDPTWTDYTVSARFRSVDDDSCGLVFRYRDDRNYYRVRLDAELRLQQLTSFQGGVARVVAENVVNPGFTQFRWQQLQVVAVGPRLVVRLDGEVLFDVVDHDHGQGRVGLYASANQLVHFDDLIVRQGDASQDSRPRHLFDDFNDGVLGPFTIVDEGTRNAPSQWVETGGMLQQLSNIGDFDFTRAGLPKLGTMAIAGPVLADQEVTVRIRNNDNDGCGVVLRYTDTDNYYRFSMDLDRGYRRLVKVVQGQWTLLWEDDSGFDQRQWHALQCSARGDRLRIGIDGTTLCDVRDGSLISGRAGLYSYKSAGVQFDDFAIQEPPVMRGVTAAVRMGTRTDVQVTAPASANRSYWLALSFSRSSGFPLSRFVPGEPRVLDLDGDPLFYLSLLPSPYLSRFSGMLDSEGRATGTVTFPSIALQALSGYEFYCGGFTYDFATPAILELLPTVSLVVP